MVGIHHTNVGTKNNKKSVAWRRRRKTMESAAKEEMVVGSDKVCGGGRAKDRKKWRKVAENEN